MEATATATAAATTGSILFSHLYTSLPSPSLSPLTKFSLSSKSVPSLIHLRISNSTLSSSLKFPLYPFNIRPTFELQSSVEGAVAIEEIPNETQENFQKKKLYVVNLPFSLSSDELKNLFSECGTVKDIEVIRDKDGKNRGYAFVTMDSGDEAQAVIDKFHSKELSGRTIKVEFAKSLKKPRPQPSTVPSFKETGHKLYVSNLQWKVRSTHLKEFFSSDFNPVSARVVFESKPSVRSAGYGFVSFSTREEAEAALSSLDGKELLGRPIRLKFSERNSDVEATKKGKETENLDESTGVLSEKEFSDESAGVLSVKEVPDDQPDES